MRTVLSTVAATLLVAAAQAQSCNGTAPAGTFRTSFAGGVYAGSTSAAVGANMFFDLAVNADVRRVNRRVWAVYQNNQERARFSGTDSRRQAIEWATKYAK